MIWQFCVPPRLLKDGSLRRNSPVRSKALSVKRYLITGGAGFIGSHLCDFLVARGDQVTVVDNLSTSNKAMGTNIEFFQGSVLNRKLLEKLVKKSDHVIHLAAAVGVLNILERPLESLITNISELMKF